MAVLPVDDESSYSRYSVKSFSSIDQILARPKPSSFHPQCDPCLSPNNTELPELSCFACFLFYFSFLYFKSFSQDSNNDRTQLVSGSNRCIFFSWRRLCDARQKKWRHHKSNTAKIFKNPYTCAEANDCELLTVLEPMTPTPIDSYHCRANHRASGSHQFSEILE